MELITAKYGEVSKTRYSQSFSKLRYIYQSLTEDVMSTVQPPTIKNSQSWSSIKRVNQIGRMRRQMLECIVMECCTVWEDGLQSTRMGGERDYW